MSQHTCIAKYTTSKGKTVDVDVVIGWDRPLQQVFMIVEELFEEMSEEEMNKILSSEDDENNSFADDNEQDESEGLYYSNLSDDHPNKNLAYFKGKLEEMGIRVPESMFIETQKDIDNNEGNRELEHVLDLET